MAARATVEVSYLLKGQFLLSETSPTVPHLLARVEKIKAFVISLTGNQFDGTAGPRLLKWDQHSLEMERGTNFKLRVFWDNGALAFSGFQNLPLTSQKKVIAKTQYLKLLQTL